MAPSLPAHIRPATLAEKIKHLAVNQLNFYRIHLLVFTFVPLFFSGVMYGINTRYHISYVDCLFLCVTSMTVTGLATVDLSTLSVMQQVLMFFQMCIGSLTFVSIIMIMVRQYFFRIKFRHVIAEQRKKGLSRSRSSFPRFPTAGPPLGALKRKISTVIRPGGSGSGPAGPPRINEDPKPPHPPGDFEVDVEHSAPSSFEMKPVHRASPPPSPSPISSAKKDKHKNKKKIDKSMIKRIGGGGMGLMNPSGWYDTDRATPNPSPHSDPQGLNPDVFSARDQPDHGESGLGTSDETFIEEPEAGDSAEFRSSASGLGLVTNVVDSPLDMPRTTTRTTGNLIRSSSPEDMDPAELPPTKTAYAGRPLTDEAFPRSRTIAFGDDEDGRNHDYPQRVPGNSGLTSAREGGYFPRTATARSQDGGGGGRLYPSNTQSTFPRTYSLHPSVSRKQESKLSGFGGFPTPIEIIRALAKRFFPKTSKSLAKTMTMQRTNTLSGRNATTSETAVGDSKEVAYISFSAVVGRNSHFHDLTEEQIDELGGVEYRALRVLLYIVTGYYLFVQLAGFVIMAPYIAAGGRYDYVFNAQPQHVTIPWFALFQSVSAFSNTGTSLSDLSMLPFQTAYLMIFVVMFLIYAGNTAFPVLLRLVVWITYKCAPKQSRLRETLKFLLDHPRRCFVYMFPSTQTWFLALVVFGLSLIDWVSFLVLDIGTETIMEIPVGTRIAAAFLQSAAVRAAGFAIVPLASLAPAVKVLYVIMMYISVYPIALSVRATNVYEERSLGLFNDEDGNADEPENEKGAQAVAKYVGWHARRQLAFDIWWLGFALWLVCIIEKGRIDQTDTATWFNIFSIIFELVSAYGTVGLSLGAPSVNYSFCGTWSTLSKLIVILVMLRGKHRGLPVAIDRAVMLPKDFTVEEEQQLEQSRSRRLSRMGSSFDGFDSDLPSAFRSHSRRGSTYSARHEISPDRRPTVGVRRETPSTPPRRESGSNSVAPSASGASAPTHSPRSLSFTLPSRPSVERSPKANMRPPPGSLTPVKESAMSRATSRVDPDI